MTRALDRPARTAPQVDLPGGIESNVIEREPPIEMRYLGYRQLAVGRQLLARGRGCRVEIWQFPAGNGIALRACLAQARFGFTQIGIVCHGCFNEVSEDGILEGAPRRRVDWGGVRRHSPVATGACDRRALIVGTYRAPLHRENARGQAYEHTV